jgi:hypothetical protein
MTALGSSPASPSVVSGTVWVYRMTETTMTIQLAASSSAGRITDMQVWTDSNPNPLWQPFVPFVWLPVSDVVYARFRDEFGNVSSDYTDTIHPINSPPPEPGPTETSTYLPLVLRNYSPSIPVQTVTVYSRPDDGEVARGDCATWSECREATLGTFAYWTPIEATVGADLESGKYAIRRVYLYFDTSALPVNAAIQSATLNFYAGLWQNGSNLRVHAVPSTQGTPLDVSDFSHVTFTSGGFADLAPSQWFQIPLNATGLTWLVKGGITRIALVHDLDLNNVAPAGANNFVISMSEDLAHQPYLTVQYTVP